MRAVDRVRITSENRTYRQLLLPMWAAFDLRPPAPDPGDDEADDDEGEEAADKDDVGKVRCIRCSLERRHRFFRPFSPLPSRLRSGRRIAADGKRKGPATGGASDLSVCTLGRCRANLSGGADCGLSSRFRSFLLNPGATRGDRWRTPSSAVPPSISSIPLPARDGRDFARLAGSRMCHRQSLAYSHDRSAVATSARQSGHRRRGDALIHWQHRSMPRPAISVQPRRLSARVSWWRRAAGTSRPPLFD
jgi:hypothetical protein